MRCEGWDRLFWRSLFISLALSAVLLTAQADAGERGSFQRQWVPEPVFEAQPGLVDMYWLAWQLAWDHVKDQEGLPQSPYIDEALWDTHIWIWDTCFMVLYCKYSPERFPGIESLDNFYVPFHSGQYNDGNYPLCIQHPDNPPLFAWVEYDNYLFTGDRDHLADLLQKKQYLQKHFEWFDTREYDWKYQSAGRSSAGTRIVKKEHGYQWGGTPSGMDNSPRTGGGPEMLWIDAIAQQGLSALYISRMAEEIGDQATADAWKKKYESIKKTVNDLYWDEEDGFYYDLVPDGEGGYRHYKIKTPASYWPLMAEMASPEQARRLAEYAKDPQVFGGAMPWPTVARNDERFVAKDGDYWKGGIWLPTGYMAIKALEKAGFGELADASAESLLEHMYRTYVDYEPHTIWECYSPTRAHPANHGESRVRPDFCGWSALGPISLFIENVLGFHTVDAREKIVKWRYHKPGPLGIKRLRFGGIETDILADGKGKVTVTSSGDYTLEINGVSHPIRKGTMEIETKPDLVSKGERAGESEDKTVIGARPSMPYRAYYGATADHHAMTIAVPNGADVRLLEAHGIHTLGWAYGTQIGWEAGPEYWVDRCDRKDRTIAANAEYPYEFVIPGISLDEWVGAKYPQVRQWIYDGLKRGRMENPEIFVAIWANGWNDDAMYEMTLDNTVDLIMTEGYTMSPTGGAGGAWCDAIREMEECAQRGLERKTVVGLGSVSDLPNFHGGQLWDEAILRYYMEFLKEEYPRCPGIAFFPGKEGNPEAYKKVLHLAGKLAKEYWPDNWLPDGVYAVTPQTATGLRMEADGKGTADGTQVRAGVPSYPADSTHQQWRFKQVADGVYRIHPSWSSAVSLTVKGERVGLWKNNSSQAQQWRLVPALHGLQLEPLNAPGHSLRLERTDAGAAFRVGKRLDDRATVFSITPEICKLDPIAPYYQAESGTLAGGARHSTEHYGHLGGYVRFPDEAGASVTLDKVDGLGGGQREIVIRYASDYPEPRSVEMAVNGSTTIVSLPPTGSWNTWRRLRVMRNLKAGPVNTITFTTNATGNPGGIDKVTVTCEAAE